MTTPANTTIDLVVSGEPRGAEIDRRGVRNHRADLAEQPGGTSRYPAAERVEDAVGTEPDQAGCGRPHRALDP